MEDHNVIYHKDGLYAPNKPEFETQQIVCYLVMLPLHVCFLIYKIGIIKPISMF